jgi:hypothetical protein
MATKSLCSVPDCGKPAHAGGMCSAHYWRWKKYGDASEGATPKNSGIRFIEDVALLFDGEDCLKWPLSINKRGYGQFGLNGKNLTAHRYICKIAKGPAPSRVHHTAHSCGHGWCVNPRHLRWATPIENNADKLLHDTHNKGERHGNSRLTPDQVLAIRKLAGSASQTEIAAQFGVSQTTIGLVIRRERWAHI